MPVGTELDSVYSLLTLREIRRYIRRSHAVAMTVAFVLAYALGSMLLGGMLLFAHLAGGTTVQLLWGNALGLNPWSYPGLLVIAPWGVVTLPFFATVSMVAVSIGVGIGMAVAVLLTLSLLRSRRAVAGRAASAGSVAGLTPAMIALVTLGACCSTTAAATAGVALVAGVTGTTVATLLLNNWYLGVFQIVVVWVALLAQELVLRVYGGLLGISTPAPAEAVEPFRFDARSVVPVLLRAILLLGGITWSLTMAAQWTVTDPYTAPVGTWLWWIVGYQLPAVLAILAALFPGALARLVLAAGRPIYRRVVRAVAVVVGAVLLVGVPSALGVWGVQGMGNELTWIVGGPAGWAIAPPAAVGVDLLFRWLLQYLLLGTFCLAVGLFPRSTLALLGAGRRDGRGTPAQFLPGPVFGGRESASSGGIPRTDPPPSAAAATGAGDSAI